MAKRIKNGNPNNPQDFVTVSPEEFANIKPTDAEVSVALTNGKPITDAFLGLAVKARKTAERRVANMTAALANRFKTFASLAAYSLTVYRFSDGLQAVPRDRAIEAARAIGRTIGAPKVSGVIVKAEVIVPGTTLTDGTVLPVRDKDGNALYVVIGKPYRKPGNIPSAAVC